MISKDKMEKLDKIGRMIHLLNKVKGCNQALKVLEEAYSLEKDIPISIIAEELELIRMRACSEAKTIHPKGIGVEMDLWVKEMGVKN